MRLKLRNLMLFLLLVCSLLVIHSTDVTAEELGTESVSAEESVSDNANIDDAEGDFQYEYLRDGTIKITGWTGTDSYVTIPATVGGRNVSIIGDKAFYNKTGIYRISVP